jgi:hypothetical protein
LGFIFHSLHPAYRLGTGHDFPAADRFRFVISDSAFQAGNRADYLDHRNLT